MNVRAGCSAILTGLAAVWMIGCSGCGASRSSTPSGAAAGAPAAGGGRAGSGGQGSGGQAASAGASGAAGPGGAAGLSGAAGSGGTGGSGPGGIGGSGAGGIGGSGGAAVGGNAGSAGTPGSGDWQGWGILQSDPKCTWYKPYDLAASVPPLTWSPCTTVKGCAAMDAPWWDKSHQAFELPRFWKTASGATYVAMVQTINEVRTRVVVYDVGAGGKPVFAWGGDGCFASVRSTYEDQILVLVSNTGAGVGYSDQLWWGSPGQVQAKSSPDFTFKDSDPGFAAFDNATLGGGVVAWEVTSIHVMDLATKKQSQLLPTPAAESLIRRLLGSATFFESVFMPAATSWRQVWVAASGAPPNLLLGPPSASIRGFDTDGAHMGWLQLSGSTADNPNVFSICDLYTSPHSADPAGVSPVRLTKVDYCAGQPAWFITQAHSGVFGMEMGNNGQAARAYSLSDGSHRVAPLAVLPGMTGNKLLWADDEEVVLQAADSVYKLARTIVRLPLSTLPQNGPAP